MLVPLVPTTLNNFACVRLVLLDGRISEKAHVVVDVEVEERARLSAGLVDDEIVKCVVLIQGS